MTSIVEVSWIVAKYVLKEVDINSVSVFVIDATLQSLPLFDEIPLVFHKGY